MHSPIPKKTSIFDNKAQEWDTPKRINLAKTVAKSIINNISLNENMDILDFGAGTGLLSQELSQYVHSITALDSSSGMRAVLQDKCVKNNILNIKTDSTSLNNLIESQYHFDIIASSMTLHHIDSVENIFKQFYQLLKHKGQIAFADLTEEGDSFHQDSHGVFHDGFSKESIVEILEKSNFHFQYYDIIHYIEKKSSIGTMKNYPIFICIASKS